MKKNIKILMAAAEIAHLAKVGGLADVVSSLPPALTKLGAEVRLIMPLYGSINKKKYKIKKIFSNISIPSAGKNIKINIWQASLQGIKIYFIDNKKYFGKKEVYFGNNSARFLFFSLAALTSLPIIKFKPDVVHCHDFHTALIPTLLKTADFPYFENIKTLYTIHNLNYQGKSEIEVLSTGNLNVNSLKPLAIDARDGDINFMVQGILSADAVNTVSPTYAKEITTSTYGAGLEKIIKANSHKISGILNGIDIDFFNPATDKNIYKKYSLNNLAGKQTNKLNLQKELKLPQDKDIALVGFVSRLAWQKGLELITKNIGKLDCQFVFLGTGQREYENQLKKLARKYPKKIKAKIMFDIGLAQKIYASSDMFLMPSRFEPCGLGQMIAMRYGTIPVARATGGLADTINRKLGFKFKEFEADALEKTLAKALNIYYKKPKKWLKMQKNCMKQDFSWNKSAKAYLKLYKNL